MFFRRQEGKYRETDRVTRFKLIKSGKHWLRASTSQFGLFKVLRGGVDAAQVTTEMIEEQSANTLTGLDILKGIAAAGTVLGGAVATQTTVYAHDALEKTVEAKETLANTDTVTLGTVKDQEGVQADSLSVSVSQSQSLSEEASKNASKHLSESESQSVSTSTSASVSASTSASESASASTSASESASTSASQSQTGATSELAKPATSETASNKETSVRKEDAANSTADAVLSKVITESLASLQAVETRLSQITSTTSSLVDTTTTVAVATTVSAESNKKTQEDRKRLSKISATMGEYLAKSIGLPNTEAAVAKVNAAVTAIEEALKTPNADLTDVIKQATSAQNSIVNAVLRSHNGKRSGLNGRQMERGVSFREVAPENRNPTFLTASVGYVVSEGEATAANSKANIYKTGTYLYATEGRTGNGIAPGPANTASRVLVQNVGDQVLMTASRTGRTTQWEVTFNRGGDPHDNPYFYFTVPKGHRITHMEVWQKDRAETGWNLLGSSNGDNAFTHNKKSGDLRAAVGNAHNNQGGSYYDNVAGVGPGGVGRGSLTSLRDFAFNNPEAYYQTDKISDETKKAGDFAFTSIENATANVYALNPRGSARLEGYKIKYTTDSPEDTNDFYMAGFRSLENSRHRNYLQMNGSPDRYWLELKKNVPSTFLKYGGLNELTSGSVSKIADVYDKVTGKKTPAPNGTVTYAIRGKNYSSNELGGANSRDIPFDKGVNELIVKTSNAGSYTLPFRIVTQADVYEPVINQTLAAKQISKGQQIDPASIIQKIDDKSNTISGFAFPDDRDTYNDQIDRTPRPSPFVHNPNVLPNTNQVSSNVQGTDKQKALNVKNVEWVGGSNQIGSGIGENMAVKAMLNGKEVYLSVPPTIEVSRLGSALTEQDKLDVLAHNGLQGKAQITGTKIGLSKQLKTIYKDDEGGDSVDVSEVFFENVAKSTATKPNVDPKNDGSVVVRPEANNDKINISYTPTTANTTTHITIKKSGTTWENSDPLPAGVTLDKSNGNLTISEEAVKDKTDVTATSYNFNSDGATTTATAKAPYQAKTDRFYAVEGEDKNQLNARDFVVDGDGRALPQGTSVKWKDSSLDLSTPGQKKATLLVTKGSETKEVEYSYTVLGKVKPWERNGETGKFYAFKADRGKDGIVGGSYANNIGGNSRLYTNIDTLSDVASFKYEYKLNNSQSAPLTTKDGSPAFSSVWHTTVESDTDNQPTTHHTTYKIIATYRQGRFGTASASDPALTSSATFDYTVADPQPKQDISTTVGNIESLKSVIDNPKTALENANPNVAFPVGSDYNWVSTPDATTVANPGIYVKEVKLTLPESTTNPGQNAGRNSKNVSVPIKVKPNPPQISADQVTKTGGLPNKGITVTNALPGAAVTLTINNRQLPSKTADSSGSVTFTADELADSNGLLQTGTVTVKQSKEFPNPVTNRNETLESDVRRVEISKETEKPNVEVVLQVKDKNNKWVDRPKTAVRADERDEKGRSAQGYELYAGDEYRFVVKVTDNSGKVRSLEVWDGLTVRTNMTETTHNSNGTITNITGTPTTATTKDPATLTINGTYNAGQRYEARNVWSRQIRTKDFSENTNNDTTFKLVQGKLSEKFPGEKPKTAVQVSNTTTLSEDDKQKILEAVKASNPQDANRIQAYGISSDGTVTITYKDGTTNTVKPDLSDSDYRSKSASTSAVASTSASTSAVASTSASTSVVASTSASTSTVASTSASTSAVASTSASTSAVASTSASTSAVASTSASTSAVASTSASTSAVASTSASTSAVASTSASTSAVASTSASTSAVASTSASTSAVASTSASTSAVASTSASTSAVASTSASTSAVASTSASTSAVASTSASTSAVASTSASTSAVASTSASTSAVASTSASTSAVASTSASTSAVASTSASTSAVASTSASTSTVASTSASTSAVASTSASTSAVASTSASTSAVASTSASTSAVASTSASTSAVASTSASTSAVASTSASTSAVASTSASTSAVASTSASTSAVASTSASTSAVASTSASTSAVASTSASTSAVASTSAST
ncbi:accessory Sec-dependent serine-rich glycoprotein adhesin, partial [Streptococcus mitis]|uniref:accessory Sec-dependent serine-rich glycoprotein adhesin n=1 Tax=Streptococcus mitis TaxID=28037 RepID=UPI0021B6BA5D